MAKAQKKRLGDMLVESGVITPEQLARAIERQRTSGERLGRILVAEGVREQDIIRALAEQLSIPVIDLYREGVDPRAAALLPEALARKYRALPVRKEGNRLLLAMADPLDVVAYDDVAIATGLLVSPAIAPEAEVLAGIERTYGLGEHARGIIEEIAPSAEDVEGALPVEEPDAPIVRLANLILAQAITDRASDIHIEPTETAVRVRYRVDGVLNTVMNVPRHAYATLVSRMKVMARMNVAERRLPQDGSFSLTAEGRTVDFRVSTIPLIYGERVALRLLDKSRAILSLPDLGMDEKSKKRFESLIKLPNGIILVSGPTGSGKTSTLISALQMLNTVERNIITVEDPVEYQIPGINQMEVNTRAGLTFANALRSIVRQDPDILMVGEIRDVETAEIATHASLTGHLVFSTIHTTDAPAVVARLLDMGVEPFLIASALAGAVAQRLVRVLCPHCKRPAAAQPELVMAVKSYVGDTAGAVQINERVGCVHCRYSGYLGRTGLFELLVMNEKLRQLVVRRASTSELAEAARAEGMRTMREDGLVKVARGITTVEEVLRVTTPVDV
ncbi:MAG TPA: GspE/PulE family protein [bacterium]|jgi:type IV pilus assembly protein PilB